MESKSTEFIPPTPFPLNAILQLHIKADYISRINYHSGFRLLCRWLSPIEVPENKYPPYPPILFNWECVELARIILNANEEEVTLKKRNDLCNVIFHTILELYGYSHETHSR